MQPGLSMTSTAVQVFRSSYSPLQAHYREALCAGEMKIWHGLHYEMQAGIAIRNTWHTRPVDVVCQWRRSVL
jgi:hypothetical protein